MGVSLDAIQGLGFQSTLQVIMEHMNSLKDPSQKAALAFRVFGRSGAEAVSILRGGMERFNEIKEKMAASGASFDMFNATNVNLFNNALSDMTMILKGIGTQLIIAIAPAMVEVAGLLMQWIQNAGGMREVVIGIVQWMAGVVSWISTAVMFVRILWNGFKMVVLTVSLIGATIMLVVLQALQLLTLGLSQTVNDLTEKARAAVRKIGQAAADIRQDSANAQVDNANVQNMVAGFERVGEAARKTTIDMKMANKAAMGDGVDLATAKMINDLGDKSVRVIERTRGAAQKLNDTFVELTRMRNLGFIDELQMGQASLVAITEAAQKLHLGESRLSGANELGSTGAVSNIIKAQVEQDRSDPNKRLEELFREALAVQIQQRNYGRIAAEALATRFKTARM